LIVYDSDVEVIFESGTAENKDFLLQKVHDIVSGSSTNLFAGLNQGFMTLNKNTKAQKRIFLFSDGLVNMGITEPKEISQKTSEFTKSDVQVSAFGIGADFDENLMKSIAESGHGDYYYITSDKEIIHIVAAALNGLMSTIGTDAVLTITAENGAILKKTFGFPNMASQGALLGDLKENDRKQILSSFEIPFTVSQETSVEFLSWELTYTYQETKQKITRTGKISIVVTKDQEKFKKDKVKDKVVLSRAIAVTAERDLVVKKLLEENKRKEAIDVQTKSVGDLDDLMILNDETGLLRMALDNEKKGLEKLEDERISMEENRKYSQFSSYMNAAQNSYSYETFGSGGTKK